MNEPAATPEDTRYWQGVMDGIALVDPDKDTVQRLRNEVAAMRHVHYSSLLGPYCVICRLDIPAPYNSFWSES